MIKMYKHRQLISHPISSSVLFPVSFWLVNNFWLCSVILKQCFNITLMTTYFQVCLESGDGNGTFL